MWTLINIIKLINYNDMMVSDMWGRERIGVGPRTRPRQRITLRETKPEEEGLSRQEWDPPASTAGVKSGGENLIEPLFHRSHCPRPRFSVNLTHS